MQKNVVSERKAYLKFYLLILFYPFLFKKWLHPERSNCHIFWKCVKKLMLPCKLFLILLTSAVIWHLTLMYEIYVAKYHSNYNCRNFIAYVWKALTKIHQGKQNLPLFNGSQKFYGLVIFSLFLFLKCYNFSKTAKLNEWIGQCNRHLQCNMNTHIYEAHTAPL